MSTVESKRSVWSFLLCNLEHINWVSLSLQRNWKGHIILYYCELLWRVNELNAYQHSALHGKSITCLFVSRCCCYYNCVSLISMVGWSPCRWVEDQGNPTYCLPVNSERDLTIVLLHLKEKMESVAHGVFVYVIQAVKMEVLLSIFFPYTNFILK